MEYSFLFGCVKSLFCASAFSAAMPRRLSLTLNILKNTTILLLFSTFKLEELSSSPNQSWHWINYSFSVVLNESTNSSHKNSSRIQDQPPQKKKIESRCGSTNWAITCKVLLIMIRFNQTHHKAQTSIHSRTSIMSLLRNTAPDVKQIQCIS